MTERFTLLKTWLHTQLGNQRVQLIPITDDASFRRYFRITLGESRYVVMDAPPDKENCQPFINVGQHLFKWGLTVPRIIAQDLKQGFLLLSDLGSQLYLSHLNEQCVDSLYHDALRALVVMQSRSKEIELPLYDHALLHQEMQLFIDWLVGQHLKLKLTEKELNSVYPCFELLSQSALAQPQVLVHRDYHSRNLMVLPVGNPGILDFQDAVKGAITYDLVSLLRDCYIAWPLERVEHWIDEYLTLAQAAGLIATPDRAQFQRWFDWMGIQRHLKASGIFARLYHRDGKAGYLQDIPRTLTYIVEVSAHYPELKALHQLIRQQVLPNYSLAQVS
ncbi:MAG: phosphotransferase [Pseudomonadota bacterium]|nr:phosphotransferase [Pseudomonadota bacterium]